MGFRITAPPRVSANPCIGPVELAPARAARTESPVYPRTRFARCIRGRSGESIMQRVVVLACAIVTFGMLASPLGAQQEPPPTGQSMSEAAQPAPTPQAETPTPPPFPPMPSARPSHRWVVVGDRHARRVHRHSTRHHAMRTHQRTHARNLSTHRARSSPHFSRRTIRSCHRMTYSQIMRHGTCRALMKHELAATTHRHHATRHHHRSRHHHSVRRHRR